MDIAVLADIHGNYAALERCLTYAISRKIDIFFFLGDYIGELPYPERTMTRLYEIAQKYTCYFVKGNKEDYWLNYRANGEQGWKDKDSTSGALLYAFRALTQKDLEFFAKLPPVQEIMFQGLPAVTICHGSPNRINEKLLPDDEHTNAIINSSKTAIILCGHTHIQGKIVFQDKCALNPGSVGIPFLSGGKTQFMLLHGDENTWTEEFISLDYEADRVIREIQESGLDTHAPCWSIVTKSILQGGEVSHSTVLSRAMELCRKETGTCIWPDIPERYWQQAVNEYSL